MTHIEFDPRLSANERNTIENIIGSWRLEGLEVSHETIQDMQRATLGEISFDEAVKAAIQRAING
ncbi:MAG: antitoxin VbhA family protein [Neisseria animaloris]|nr:antitoxin VbhA family protein [Neisseria animaloris]